MYRSAYVLVSFVLCLIVAFQYKEVLLYLCGSEFFKHEDHLIITHVSEAFWGEIQCVLSWSFFFVLPFGVSQVYSFFRSALYSREVERVRFLLILSCLCVCGGLAFSLYVFIPTVWAFLLGCAEISALPLHVEVRFESYIIFFWKCIFLLCTVFQFPVLLCALSFIGISRERFLLMRPFVVWGIFFMAAVCTPPDVVSQLLFGLPLVFLYEGFIFILGLVEEYSLVV